MSLPTQWLEEGSALAAGATLFGQPFDQFTQSELIAIAALGWHKYNKAQRDECERSIHHMRSLAELSRAGFRLGDYKP